VKHIHTYVLRTAYPTSKSANFSASTIMRYKNHAGVLSALHPEAPKKLLRFSFPPPAAVAAAVLSWSPKSLSLCPEEEDEEGEPPIPPSKNACNTSSGRIPPPSLPLLTAPLPLRQRRLFKRRRLVTPITAMANMPTPKACGGQVARAEAPVEIQGRKIWSTATSTRSYLIRERGRESARWERKVKEIKREREREREIKKR